MDANDLTPMKTSPLSPMQPKQKEKKRKEKESFRFQGKPSPAVHSFMSFLPFNPPNSGRVLKNTGKKSLTEGR